MCSPALRAGSLAQDEVGSVEGQQPGDIFEILHNKPVSIVNAAMKKKIKASDTGKNVPSLSAKPPAKIFYVVSLFIPIVFFILLEAGLRVFNYGFDYTLWVNPAKGVYVLNPDLAHKYFHDIEGVPYSIGDMFD